MTVSYRVEIFEFEENISSNILSPRCSKESKRIKGNKFDGTFH